MIILDDCSEIPSLIDVSGFDAYPDVERSAVKWFNAHGDYLVNMRGGLVPHDVDEDLRSFESESNGVQ